MREDVVFKDLIKMCPGLAERLKKSSDEEVEVISDLVCPNHLTPMI